MKKTIAFFCLLFLSFPVLSQQLGISGAFANLKTNYSDDYLYRNPFEKNMTQIGGRVELTFLKKACAEVLGQYRAVGIECYNPIYDSAYIWTVSGRSDHTVMTKTFINLTARIGIEIPQHWNDFLTINVGVGAGLLEGRRHFQIDSLKPTEQIEFYRMNPTDPMHDTYMKPGKNTAYYSGFCPEAFVNVFYEFKYFRLFAGYTFRYVATHHINGALMQHSINFGIFLPFKHN